MPAISSSELEAVSKIGGIVYVAPDSAAALPDSIWQAIDVELLTSTEFIEQSSAAFEPLGAEELALFRGIGGRAYEMVLRNEVWKQKNYGVSTEQ